MGFLQRLFGGKKPPNPRPDKGRRLWSFSRSFNNTPNKRDLQSPRIANDTLDANKHAIAVAAATAAVAEAALAAAHAAAEVVRLTSGGPAGSSHRLLVREMAAVRIQSAFRAYLARRALRALKALVKLQALVRGHIVRKQTADMLRRMQTLVRLQARARASRAESLNSSTKFSSSKYAVPASPDKDEYQFRVYSTKFDAPSILTRCGSNSKLRDLTDLEKAKMGSNWLDRWMEDSIWSNSRDTSARHGHVDDDKSDKILEVDTWKPRLNSQQSSRMLQHGFPSGHNNYSFMASESPRKMAPKASYPGEAPRIPSAKAPGGRDQASARTGENSPQVHSASSRPGSTSARRSPFTPTRSECSWGYFNGYPGHPNYMAYTESSRAKFRSQSAPRQRLEFDRYGSMNRSLQGFFWEPVTNERECGKNSDPRCKAYPASERLSRPGTPNRR